MLRYVAFYQTVCIGGEEYILLQMNANTPISIRYHFKRENQVADLSKQENYIIEKAFSHSLKLYFLSVRQ